MALGPVLHVGGLGGPAAVEPGPIKRHSESSDIPKGGSHTIRNGLRSPRSRATASRLVASPHNTRCGPEEATGRPAALLEPREPGALHLQPDSRIT